MDIQQEIRILNTALELITNYVNYSICCFPEGRDKIVKSFLPKDTTAKKYFYILLLEVVAGVNKEIVPSKEDGDNILNILHKVSKHPELDAGADTAALEKAVEEFQDWLSHEFEYDIYSANIGKELRVNLSRKDALYLIGNRCKHALTRSNAILKKITNIYNQSGAELDPGSEVIVLEDIDTWLFDDFGGYHFTKLCELSVNLYYGIIGYVRPTYERSLVQEDSISYSYLIPKGVVEEESKFEYYELLNRVRSPFLPVIKTWENLLELY